MAYCPRCQQDREVVDGCCAVCGAKMPVHSHLDDLQPMCQSQALMDYVEEENAQQLEAILQAHVEKERQERKAVPVSVVKKRHGHLAIMLTAALAAAVLLVVVVASVITSMQQNQRIEAQLETFVQCMEEGRLQDAILTFDPMQSQPFLEAIRITFNELSPAAQELYAQQFVQQVVDVPLILSARLQELTILDIRIVSKQGSEATVKMTLQYAFKDGTSQEKEHIVSMVRRDGDWYIRRT